MFNGLKQTKNNCGVDMEPHNMLSFISIRFYPTQMFSVPNHAKTSSHKACETKKFMIVSKVAHVWPTLLTMARGGQSSCQTHDMYHH
jgi:hypothetical protein